MLIDAALQTGRTLIVVLSQFLIRLVDCAVRAACRVLLASSLVASSSFVIEVIRRCVDGLMGAPTLLGPVCRLLLMKVVGLFVAFSF